MSTEAPGSQLLLLGFTLYFSGAVVRTCTQTISNAFKSSKPQGGFTVMRLTLKATRFLVTLVKMMRHFLSVSPEPKLSSSAGLNRRQEDKHKHLWYLRKSHCSRKRDAAFRPVSISF